MAGKTGNKKRPSVKYNDGSLKGSVTRTRQKLNKTIGRYNNNDFEGEIGNVNQNDFEGVTSSDFTTNVSGHDFDGVTFPSESEAQETSFRGQARQNVLHRYASYNTLFTLSGVNEIELKTHSFLTDPVHDVIARSGGIGDPNISDPSYSFNKSSTRTGSSTVDSRANEAEAGQFKKEYGDSIDILTRGHDIFFENVNMISTGSPNEERNLGNFTKMEFELHEPYGVTFIEKLRAAARLNKYLDYQDAPMLLTIEFKGFDEKGDTFVHHPSNRSHVRKIPIIVSRVEFDVNQAGAVYTAIAVPYTDLAYDDRFKFPRASMPLASNNADEWTVAAMKALAEDMKKEIDQKKREFADEYEFRIHSEVRVNGEKYKGETSSTNQEAQVADVESLDEFLLANVEDSGQKPELKSSSGEAVTTTALTKFFEDAIRNSYGYQKLVENFWTSYLRGAGVTEDRLKSETTVSDIIKSGEISAYLKQDQFVDWFKIKTTVETDTSRLDRVTKMHPKKIIYMAVPYKIHVLKLIAPGVSIGKVDWSKKVDKEYNYIYTGENTDVQNIRIHYKAAYFHRNVRSAEDKSTAETGLFTHIAETVREVFGAEGNNNDQPEPNLPMRQYPSTIKGRSALSVVTRETPKSQQFYDYLTNPQSDMLRIELEILGDPAYICQDMYVPIHQNRISQVGGKNSTYNKSFESFNADQSTPLLSLTYRVPDDIDEKEGTMFTAKHYEENLFFNGLYEVNKVESKFDNGQFTQVLYCTRFNNQQGKGLAPILVDSAVKGLEEISEAEQLKKRKDKASGTLNTVEEYINSNPLDTSA